MVAMNLIDALFPLWRMLVFGLHFQTDIGCPHHGENLCEHCDGECDGYECVSPLLSALFSEETKVPLVMRVSVKGATPRYEEWEDWDFTYHKEYRCGDKNLNGVYLLKFQGEQLLEGGSPDGMINLYWQATVCDVVVTFCITYMPQMQMCSGNNTGGFVGPRWIQTVSIAVPPPPNTALQGIAAFHQQVFEGIAWTATYGPHLDSFYSNTGVGIWQYEPHVYPVPNPPLEAAAGEYPYYYATASAPWYGCEPYGGSFFGYTRDMSASDDPFLIADKANWTLQATVEPGSFEDIQNCCRHGYYCPDYTVTETEDDLIDGMCCASVSVSGIDQSEPLCYFGYPAAYVSPGLGGMYKHAGCGYWVRKHSTCTNPYPNKLVIAPAIDANTGMGHWCMELTGWEMYVSPRYPDGQWRSITLYGESREFIDYSSDPENHGSVVCERRATKELLDGIVMRVLPEYVPDEFGQDYSNATASASFGGTWDECKDDGVPMPILYVWGWRLKFTDPRGIENSLVFQPEGGGLTWEYRQGTPTLLEQPEGSGLIWRNGLSAWRLRGDSSLRPGAAQISLEGSCERLGYNHGFCFDNSWIDAEKPTATCKVVELISDALSRYYYMQCGFLPGSHITLEPLLEPPDPSEGSVCVVAEWLLTWNKDPDDVGVEIPLTWDDGDNRWEWEPTEHQVYRLTRQADGENGEGNYKLEIELSYPITALSQESKTFTIGGDHFWEFAAGTTFTVAGSTGNDGDYTVDEVNGSGGNTIITVTEAILNATVDGNATKSLTDTVTTAAVINCCYSEVLTVSLGTGETATLTAGGTYMTERSTGCHSRCDADYWEISATNLPPYAESRSGVVQYFPAVYSWWWVGEQNEYGNQESLCVVRLADDEYGHARYAAYCTYLDGSGANVFTAACIVTGGGDCCSDGELTCTNSQGVTFTIAPHCARHLVLHAKPGIFTISSDTQLVGTVT